MRNEDVYSKTPWKSLDSYFDFAVRHNVYGLEAKKLWEQLYRQTVPIPKVRKNGT